MKLKELLNKYGEYEIKDVAKIESLLEKPKPKTVWDLKDNDKYFYIEHDGTVYEDIWCSSCEDIFGRNQGHYFLTKEDAEYESKRREVYTIVKKHSYDFSREEWENRDIAKWLAYYCYGDGEFIYSYDSISRTSQLYFKSKEDVKAAIEEVGEADFIKYYLGVKDYVDQESR